MILDIRKIIVTRELVLGEMGEKAAPPIARAVALAVIANPFAGKVVEDLRALYEAGAALGERLMPELVRLLDRPAVSYGKGQSSGGPARWSMAGPADARCARRRPGADLVERQGGAARHADRRAARPQGRRLVVRAFRHVD